MKRTIDIIPKIIRGYFSASYKISLTLLKHSLFIGFVITLYVFFFDPSRNYAYDFFIYHKEGDKATISLITSDIQSSILIRNYYQAIKDSNSNLVNAKFFCAPINTKARILDTVDNKFLKIEYEYLNELGRDRIERSKGFIMIEDVHVSPH